MKKYCLFVKTHKELNAFSKAVLDVNSIVQKQGYDILEVEGNLCYTKNKFFSRLFQFFKAWFKVFSTLKNGDIIMLQWPNGIVLNIVLYIILRLKKVHVQILIHDISSLRFCSGDYAGENRFMRLADWIIVHTPRMKEYLETRGFESHKMKILYSFDYLTEDSLNVNRTNSKEIVFAGNLSPVKSNFLYSFPKKIDFNLNCYGKYVDDFPDYLNYKQAFEPENVSVLEGSWGLVWDGDSCETCSGSLGNYLKYNSSHKLSLYVVAGLPLIVWSQSGLADYVISHGLGIVVDNLGDISLAIKTITDSQYSIILKNISKEANILRTGGHLLSLL